jgi:hypothetical protein
MRAIKPSSGTRPSFPRCLGLGRRHAAPRRPPEPDPSPRGSALPRGVRWFGGVGRGQRLGFRAVRPQQRSRGVGALRGGGQAAGQAAECAGLAVATSGALFVAPFVSLSRADRPDPSTPRPLTRCARVGRRVAGLSAAVTGSDAVWGCSGRGAGQTRGAVVARRSGDEIHPDPPPPLHPTPPRGRSECVEFALLGLFEIFVPIPHLKCHLIAKPRRVSHAWFSLLSGLSGLLGLSGLSGLLGSFIDERASLQVRADEFACGATAGQGSAKARVQPLGFSRLEDGAPSPALASASPRFEPCAERAPIQPYMRTLVVTERWGEIIPASRLSPACGISAPHARGCGGALVWWGWCGGVGGVRGGAGRRLPAAAGGQRA